MDSGQYKQDFLLCLRCRRAGHQTLQCPGSSVIGEQLETFESDSRRSEASLCRRCSEFDIANVARSNNLQDELDHWNFVKTFNRGKSSWDPGWKEHYQNLRFTLGPAPSIILQKDCPLCRLIFAIFPRDVVDWSIVSNPEPWYLRPYPPYDRTGKWNAEVPPNVRSQYAVYFTVEQEHGEWRHRLESSSAPMQGANLAFAASHTNTSLTRRALAARKIPLQIEYKLICSWIDHCNKNHGAACRRKWDDRILSCRMIDVEVRRVVDCPPDCDYVALSYVWGGVHPEDGALEKGSLPQTIEDAIEVTKGIGRRFLWVDALCVDQEPTPKQREQLNMMDIIYGCATITIVALSGESAAEGLPGVSGRLSCRAQGRECVDDIEFLTLGVTPATLLNNSIYFTRAWTMQEVLFSKSRLFFSNQQIHFMCNRASFCEGMDETIDPASYLEVAEPRELQLQVDPSEKPYTPEERRRIGDEDYRQMVGNYTQRRMTNDADSINAFLGIQNYLTASWILQGFTYGLPMQDFPQSLRWYHDRSVQSPRRRVSFPSWSWTGYEGPVVYDRPLDVILADFDGQIAKVDMTVRYVQQPLESQTMVLEGFLAKLKVVTEPFSEAYTSDGSTLLGVLRERNFLHNNTIPTGDYDCLVIERNHTKGFGDTTRQNVDMLLLSWKNNNLALRKTFVRLSLEKGVDFQKTARPETTLVTLA